VKTRHHLAISAPAGKRFIPFSIESYRNLKLYLGEMDQLAATIVISLRTTERHLDALKDTAKFLRESAREIGCSVSLVQGLSKSKAKPVHLLLVGAHQHAEWFFSEYSREQKAMGRSGGVKQSKESPLQHVVREMKSKIPLNEMPKSEWQEILEFYRLIRNAFVHKNISRERIDQACENALKLRQYVKREFRLDAPNSFDMMNFDDYLLFTRSIKYVANSLAANASPERALDLINYLNSLGRNNTSPIVKLARHRGDKERLRLAIRKWFKGSNQFDISKYPVWEDELVAYIQKLPNKYARRKGSEKVTLVEAAREIIPSK
jgi:hypothetical protein